MAYAHSRHTPSRIPRAGVEVRHREADFLVRLEATRGRDHLDARWLEGVVGGKDDGAEILAIGIGTVWRTTLCFAAVSIDRRTRHKLPSTRTMM